MGTMFSYYISGAPKGELSLEAIESIFHRAQDALPNFTVQLSSNSAYLEHATLPDLGSFEGIDIKQISVDGHLPSHDKSLDDFAEVLKRGESSVGSIGLLLLRCGFEEVTSKQSKRYCDMATIRIEKGKSFFSYRSNASNVVTDIRYRKQFFASVIETLGLPLELVNDGDSFRLVHTAGGQVAASGSISRDNPSHFSCEIPNATADSLIAMMRRFLETFSKRRFRFEWTARESPGDETQLSRMIFDLVLQKQFPAKRYSLEIGFRVSDPITALATIRNMCGPKDEIYTRILSFTLENENADYGECLIITSSAGHRLELQLNTPDILEVVEGKLQLKLVARK